MSVCLLVACSELHSLLVRPPAQPKDIGLASARRGGLVVAVVLRLGRATVAAKRRDLVEAKCQHGQKFIQTDLRLTTVNTSGTRAACNNARIGSQPRLRSLIHSVKFQGQSSEPQSA